MNKTAYSHVSSKGQTYYLHAKEVTLKNGRTQTIYFFAKDIREGALSEVPEGRQVSETKTGLLVLKKIK